MKNVLLKLKLINKSVLLFLLVVVISSICNYMFMCVCICYTDAIKKVSYLHSDI